MWKQSPWALTQLLYALLWHFVIRVVQSGCHRVLPWDFLVWLSTYNCYHSAASLIAVSRLTDHFKGISMCPCHYTGNPYLLWCQRYWLFMTFIIVLLKLTAKVQKSTKANTELHNLCLHFFSIWWRWFSVLYFSICSYMLTTCIHSMPLMTLVNWIPFISGRFKYCLNSGVMGSV